MGNWVSCYNCFDCDERTLINRNGSPSYPHYYVPTAYVPNQMTMGAQYFPPILMPPFVSPSPPTLSLSKSVELPGFSFEYDLSNSISDEIACGICLDDYCNGAVLQMLPCNHIMHRTCLLEWYQKSQTCPICRDKENPSAS